MTKQRGNQWGGSISTRGIASVLFAAAISPGIAMAGATTATASVGPQVEVIVRQASGAGDGPEGLVALVGGTVVNQLPVIDGFLARVPSSGLATLRASTDWWRCLRTPRCS